MKNNKDEKIRISIINGFLGSGKTTLLTHYISELLKNDEKIKIIMNEFGSFDIDSNSISNEIEVYSLINGCVCCDLKQELVSELTAIALNGDVNHVIIEATGIAHPLELLIACQDPKLVSYFEKPTIIGVLDAKRFLNRHQYTDNTVSLMEDQLKLSDIVIINKIDLVTDDNIQIIKSQLYDICPGGMTYTTTFGHVPLNTLLLKTKNKQLENENHQHHHHHHGIKSMHYTFSSPIDRQLFYQFILKLPDSVLRLKGYVTFRDKPDAIYEFQYAYGLPDYGIVSMNVPLTIVIIGENLDTNQLRNQLDMLQFT
ncbi:GTP-binding protein [Staphylococcus sp. 30400_3112M30941]|nr:GTP-binding protein [Staphylococcus sp. 30403_3112M30944]MBO0945539.1 GTP-binding protein [Staphylococcus sp. 30402_3112M30943]MBO0963711.1 GTP-binding protein [Staphylococcus sp. 30400_3112M30941]MBO0967600.1 GTP-binding protein [Staphylococcus sp. 30401_3112M30942]